MQLKEETESEVSVGGQVCRKLLRIKKVNHSETERLMSRLPKVLEGGKRKVSPHK